MLVGLTPGLWSYLGLLHIRALAGVIAIDVQTLLEFVLLADLFDQYTTPPTLTYL